MLQLFKNLRFTLINMYICLLLHVHHNMYDNKMQIKFYVDLANVAKYKTSKYWNKQLILLFNEDDKIIWTFVCTFVIERDFIFKSPNQQQNSEKYIYIFYSHLHNLDFKFKLENSIELFKLETRLNTRWKSLYSS